MRAVAEGPSVLVTLRLAARDRALLEALLARERRDLEDLGVEVSLSSVMRKLIRAAAKGAALDLALATELAPSPSALAPTPATRVPRAVSQARVRALLREKTAERRGLAAELARTLGVERAQISRFKAGKEAFPAAKLGALNALLSSASSGVRPSHG